MASSLSNSFVFLFFFFATFAISTGLVEKTTHLHFYFHDMRDGPNATSLAITSFDKSPSNFGGVGVFDNALTVGPELTSKHIGRGQGMVVDVALSGQAIMAALNFVFTEGKYNGSSLALYGRANLLAPPPAERPIIGGSGQFRLARGYSLGKILKASPEYVLAEFDIHVKHFV